MKPKELVFLLEEASAKALLSTLLPRFLSPQIKHRLIAFEGKQDLEKQLAHKIRSYQNPHARFIVLRDQDSTPDCRTLKQKLLDLCAPSTREDAVLVRIACRELEAFYLADLAAVEKAFSLPGLEKRLQKKALYRAPDTALESPSHTLHKLTQGQYQKVGGSRSLGEHLDVDNTRSVSFQHLVLGIRKWEKALLDLPVGSTL
jgi:hypothetical protein